MELTTFLGLLSVALYLLVIWVISARYRAQISPQLRDWLLATLLVAMLANLSFLLQNDDTIIGSLTPNALTVIGMSALIALVSSLTPLHLQRGSSSTWLAASLIWWAGLVLVAVLEERILLGEPDWFADVFSPAYIPGLYALAGWGLLIALGLLMSFYVLYAANLPEVAYRATYWVITLPITLMGAVLAASGSPVLEEMGLILQMLGMMGIVYVAVSLQVIDFRRNIRTVFSVALYTLLSMLITFAVLLAADENNFGAGDSFQRVSFLLGLALAAALIYRALRLLVESVLLRMLVGRQQNVAAQINAFAEATSAEVELDRLLEVVMENLRRILKVRRGGLLFIREEDGAYRLLPSQPGELPPVETLLDAGGPIAQRLLVERKPLLQYELDFDPSFQGVTPASRDFFKALDMVAYAPVMPYGNKLGILCAGRKTNDSTFTPEELDLLSTIANQAGVALRNARLLADLRHREQEAVESSSQLQATKEQLEQLDAVKTDFITIASHELRTPLAQIRGYTDIIEALNSQGMLDPDQLDGMISNLRKATDRMEELIRNMLDVSQLDVNAMDMNFSKTTIESVVRLALEPLTESIRNRKQSLTARGLRGLPEIEADMQRLVQALQNVVLNAVKFTPDGGRVEITGSLVKNDKTGNDEVLLSVTDTGIGIDRKNLDIIFEKFVRAHDPNLHSTGKTKFMGAGPGLGLTIARGVIEGHGGRITVESAGYDAEKFPGSTFHIYLPVKPPEDATRTLTFETSSAGFDREKLHEEVERVTAEESAVPKNFTR